MSISDMIYWTIVLVLLAWLVYRGIIKWRESRYDEIADIKAMNTRFGFLIHDHPTMLTKRKLRERINCMQEELDEFETAVDCGSFEGQADALIDLVVFAKGTAVMMGLPWEELWDDVMRANLSKIPGSTERSKTDLIKPGNWVPPQTEGILRDHGFFQQDYEDGDGNIIEAYCADDNAAPITAVPVQGDING